ncbi:MAG: GntR family transcriptional regulator [Ktedonobacterales bacterium]
MSTIYRNSPVPRYHQLKEILRERIRSGEWKPGDLIPSERELSETYRISRMTARQAITDLVNEGVFYREQGRGTFVTHHKITQQLMRLTGFTEDISARGQVPGTKVLSAEMCPADEAVAERLRIAIGTPVFSLQRLRLADSEPLAIEWSHINFRGCERLLDDDLEHNSLYKLLDTKYGVPLMEAEQELEAGLASEEDAQLLLIPAGSAVLFTRRTTYTERNEPIEYATSIYCGNKYVFYTHLKRDQLFS